MTPAVESPQHFFPNAGATALRVEIPCFVRVVPEVEQLAVLLSRRWIDVQFPLFGAKSLHGGVRPVQFAEPLTGGTNPPDVFLTGVLPSVEAWARMNMKLQAAGGPSLGRHFNSVLDCEPRLFLGQRVVPPPE